MNILLCSAGRRVKLINYFKEELKKFDGMIVAVDCDSSAPALQFADRAEIVPPISDPEYIKYIIQLCRKHNINAVLSLIDPELRLLAESKEEFEKENIKVIISSKEVVDICFDKYLTSKFLHIHNLPYVPTYIRLEDIISEIKNNLLEFPLILKPKNGSASLGIIVVQNLEELLTLWKESGELVAQPYIKGNEYGVDCYLDLLSKKPTHIFCKRKIKMRAGETDKSIAVKDPELLQLIEDLMDCLNPIGPIDVDCFKTEDGYLISEINPRFGGGYPHAHEAGHNYVRNIVMNLMGVTNKVDIGNYSEGSVLIKFDDVVLLNSLNQTENPVQVF